MVGCPEEKGDFTVRVTGDLFSSITTDPPIKIMTPNPLFGIQRNGLTGKQFLWSLPSETTPARLPGAKPLALTQPPALCCSAGTGGRWGLEGKRTDSLCVE